MHPTKVGPAGYAVMGALMLAMTSCDIADLLDPVEPVQEIPPVPLTPARKLVGTWSTNAPVTFWHQTDFCTGQRATVASSTWHVTWVITAVEGYTNVLNIEMKDTRSGSTPTQSSCGGDSGWVPFPPLTVFQATVSSSAIGADNTRLGLNISGSYDQSQMMMTWVRYSCQIYCFGEFTEPQKLQLFRKS